MSANVRRRMAVATILLGTLALPARAESPRLLQGNGLELLEKGEFAAAAEQFNAAAEAATGTNLDPAIPRYNAGRALADAGDHDAAVQAYTQALRTTDLALQQRAYHNWGNALVRKANSLEQSQDLDGAMTTLREAQTMFAQAITLDPNDNSPKINYELTAKHLEELQKQKQEQEQQEQQQDQQQDQQDQQQDQQDQQQDQQNQDQQNQQQDQQQDQQDQQDQSQQDQQDQQPQDQQPDQDDTSESQDSSGGQPRPSEEMTEQEAKMMLDAIREEEGAERRNVRVQYGQPRQVEKDW